MNLKLRFRQIHLDFHTSPEIPGIGAAFDKKVWQDRLSRARVNSITSFASCHHGWCYYDTSVGKMHPHLKFDLLRAQMDACKEIDVNVPVYLTAGVNNQQALEHPEWREVGHDGRYTGWVQNIMDPGFHMMCFNTPYLDFLCAQIRDVARKFPEADGIFLDIILQGECCCKWCMASMHEQGLDPTVQHDRAVHARRVLDKYYEATTTALREVDPNMPIFHNSGHIQRGRRDILKWFSHLELESLPTGGWGYDHFPMSAKYCHLLGKDFLGMTGKFHTTWGEFGGFKHPNALRYECATMIAFGSKCSIGDQLHPGGELDESTYEQIGAAYKEVEAKEAWCDDVVNLADIAILSEESVNRGGLTGHGAQSHGDTGATRILLESHALFEIIDGEMDFSKYKLLILPDSIALEGALLEKVRKFHSAGGKLFLSGQSGLDVDGKPLFDLGAELQGRSPFSPDFIAAAPEVRPGFVKTPFVSYVPSMRLKPGKAQSLGDIHDPYFNRTYKHFCSHQHTPFRPEVSGYSAGVLHGNIVYLPMPIFGMYAGYGAVVYKEYVVNCLKRLLGRQATLICQGMLSTSRVNLTEQTSHRRYVLHLLHANTIARGGSITLSGGHLSTRGSIEVIEDLQPLRNIAIQLQLPRKILKASLEPQGENLPLSVKDGIVSLKLEEFVCHQMIALHF